MPQFSSPRSRPGSLNPDKKRPDSQFRLTDPIQTQFRTSLDSQTQFRPSSDSQIQSEFQSRQEPAEQLLAVTYRNAHFKLWNVPN